MILLDTCTLLWLAGGMQKKLSETACESLRRHPGQLCVSSISALEIGLKSRKGQLELPMDPRAWFQAALAEHGIREIPVDGDIAARAAMLPPLHADPCDRVIVATAERYDGVVLTPDALLHAYPQARCRW